MKKTGYIKTALLYFMKNPLFLLISLGLFSLSCGGSSTSVKYKNPEFDSGKNYRIAVLPLKSAPVDEKSGEIVTDIFEKTLFTNENLDVLERSRFKKIIAKQNPGEFDLLEDPVATGKMLNVDLIMLGAVTDWFKGPWGGQRTNVGVSIKVINVKTGKTYWSIDETYGPTYFTDGIPTNAPCEMAAKKLCKNIVDDFMSK